MMPRFSAECMACAVLKQSENMPAEWDDEKRAAYLRGVMNIICSADVSEGAPVVTGKIEALAQEYGIEKFDYTEIKREYNRIMLDILPEIRKKVEEAEDSVEAAMKYSRAANYIDFGTQHKVTEEGLLERLEKASAERLDEAEYGLFRRDIDKAEKLVFITDNCGEIVADMLLIEKIREIKPDLKITVIVRGMPVINDATMEDAHMVGIDRVAEVMGNGNGVAGTFIEKMDSASLSRLRDADVVISKGQANFETLNGCGMNIYYLFLCKCSRFERRFGMAKLQGVIKNDRRLEN